MSLVSPHFRSPKPRLAASFPEPAPLHGLERAPESHLVGGSATCRRLRPHTVGQRRSRTQRYGPGRMRRYRGFDLRAAADDSARAVKPGRLHWLVQPGVPAWRTRGIARPIPSVGTRRRRDSRRPPVPRTLCTRLSTTSRDPSLVRQVHPARGTCSSSSPEGLVSGTTTVRSAGRSLL